MFKTRPVAPPAVNKQTKKILIKSVLDLPGESNPGFLATTTQTLQEPQCLQYKALDTDQGPSGSTRADSGMPG